MPRKPSHLRPATDEDVAKAVADAKPKSLTDAVESGTYLEILIAQRVQMIQDLPDVNGPAKAALHRQIALHSKEIDGLQAAAKQEVAEDEQVDDEDFDEEAI